MSHPLLYELNTRQWLAALSAKHGRDIDLFGVPETELDRFEKLGVTHIWAMGVWPTGPKSRKQALLVDDLRKAYDEALPGWSDEDVLGSPYAVGALHVSPLLGGDAGLEAFRDHLDERGIGLLLDFVPNHLGLDHAWVFQRPQLFVGQSAPFPDSALVNTPLGPRHLAFGKDPYFPGWTDTIQLDYRKAETRAAMNELLLSVAARCDGVRCDMAMLLLADVFQKTWSHVPVDVDPVAGEFWHDAIAAVKQRYPKFLFLAEAYWDLEGKLCELGFDFAYDKRLYDFVVHDRPWDIQPHLVGLGAHNERRAHFLENHDEPRIAATTPLDLHGAATALVLGLPGMRFLHDGELEGRRRFARVQLARHADEPIDEDIQQLYARVLAAVKESAIAVDGKAKVLEAKPAWEQNPTHRCINLVEWRGARTDRFDLVVVNLASHRAQCYAPLSFAELAGGEWHLADRLSAERYERSGNELAAKGLYLDVGPRSAHIFSFRRP